MPTVSVIIPSYNRAHLIRQTIDSALAQTYQDFEVLVVDDGSMDNTLSVLEEYGNQIRVICQPHQGMAGSYARNTGIREAKGQFIAFLDSDDLWLPTKLECQMTVLEAEPELAWVYSDAEAFDHDTGRLLYLTSKNHRLYQGDVLEQLFIENFISSITPVIRRAVFEKVGEFWPTPSVTDWDMMLRIAAHYPIKLVPQVLARVRLHQNRVTESLSGEAAYKAAVAVIERAVAREPERLGSLKNKALARLRIRTGRLLARDGYRAEARKMFSQAIQLDPGNGNGYIYWLGSLTSGSILRAAIRFRRWVRYQRSRNG